MSRLDLPDEYKDVEPVTIETGPRKGQVLTGRRARRYREDQAYRDHYDGVVRPQVQNQPPSLLRKAANLGRDAVAHLRDSARKVPLEVYNSRLEQCRGCELYVDNHCTHRRCGCQMVSETKLLGALWWASKSCPDDPPRWGPWKGEEAKT